MTYPQIINELFIAEKPSLAKKIIATFGSHRRGDGWVECNNNIVVTWQFGHLLRQKKPVEYDPNYVMSDLSCLPYWPKKFELLPAYDKLTEAQEAKIRKGEKVERTSTGSIKQLNIIKDLSNRAAVIINAGDPDREGQLLVDETLEYLGINKPTKRILLLNLKPDSIKKAYRGMKDNKEYKLDYLSGILRQQSDWLIGFNYTPVMTDLFKKIGYNEITSIGRIQTAVLKLIVDRCNAYNNYKPLNYYNLVATFIKSSTFKGMLELTQLTGQTDDKGRILDQQILEVIKSKVDGKNGVVVDYDKSEAYKNPPLPLCLTSLQSIANKKLGYSIKEIDRCAQKLYEAEIISYPRSDVPYLFTEDYKDGAKLLPELLKLKMFKGMMTPDPTIKSPAFNSAKIEGKESHYAIIPTGVNLNKLETAEFSDKERSLFELIAFYYIIQFYPPMKYEKTTIGILIEGYNFRTNGNKILEPGWKQAFGLNNSADSKSQDEDGAGDENNDDEDSQILPNLTIGDTVKCESSNIEKSTTTKPVLFTEGLLVKTMKQIHTIIDDCIAADYPDKAKAKEVAQKFKQILKENAGLGTVATRSEIINKLVQTKVVMLDKKKIIATQKGYDLIKLLCAPENYKYFSTLVSPITTAILEQQLEDIINGKMTKEQFEGNIRKIVDNVKFAMTIDVTAFRYKPEHLCPQCNKGELRKIQYTTKAGEKAFLWGCSKYKENNCKPYKDDKGKPKLTEDPVYTCPSCGKRLFQNTNSKDNKKFWRCSAWSQGCKTILEDIKNKPDFDKQALKKAKTIAAIKAIDEECPKCGSPLTERSSKSSKKTFIGCSTWPKCDYTRWPTN